MQLYLALTPEEYPRFMNRSAAFVHMAYQCSPEGTLTRLPLTTGEQRGLLGLNSHGLAESADAGTLFPQLLRECRQLGFSAAFLMYPECSDLLEDLLPAQQKNRPLHP